jgi:hypothetical protein
LETKETVNSQGNTPAKRAMLEVSQYLTQTLLHTIAIKTHGTGTKKKKKHEDQ